MDNLELRIELNNLWNIHKSIDWISQSDQWINKIKEIENKFPEFKKLNRKRIKIINPLLPKFFSSDIIIDLINGIQDIKKIDKILLIREIYENYQSSPRMDEYLFNNSRYEISKIHLSNKYPELSDKIDSFIDLDLDSFIKNMI